MADGDRREKLILMRDEVRKREESAKDNNEEARIRQSRKLEHIKCSLVLSDGPVSNGLEDVFLVNQSLPELDLEEVDVSFRFGAKTLQIPLIINAITGGHQETACINQALSRVACRAGVAMAVGSQKAALEDKRQRASFSVVRQENPEGVIMANIGASATPEEAEEAIDMIAADALQIHLNVPQELAMPEGERSFRGYLDNIEKIVQRVKVPVIVKEVGFGLSREAAGLLYRRGVKWLDTGGQGGTNFIAIERERGSECLSSEFNYWGIPTAISLLEALSLRLPLKIIASGGIRTSLEIAKCLALGAEMVGIAGYYLRLLLTRSEEVLLEEIQRCREELRAIMLMLGAADLAALRSCPVVIVGRCQEWLRQRGIDTASYARRGFVFS